MPFFALRPRCGAAGGGGGGTSPLFEMNISSGASPSYGWSGGQVVPDNAIWTYTFRSGGGPGGRNAVEISRENRSTCPGVGNQPGKFGYFGTGESPAPGGGVSRFYRLYMRVETGSVFAFYDWSDCSNGNGGDKVIEVQNGSANGRAILHSGYQDDTPALWRWMLEFSDATTDTGFIYALNTWYAIQMEIHWSTNGSTADGYAKVWVNNDTYASPTLQVLNEIAPAEANQAEINFGYYSNYWLRSGGSLVKRIGAFEYDDAFDSSWHADME